MVDLAEGRWKDDETEQRLSKVDCNKMLESRKKAYATRNSRNRFAGNILNKVDKQEQSQTRGQYNTGLKLNLTVRSNLFLRVSDLFSESSPCLLELHGSCRTAQLPVKLSKNILQNVSEQVEFVLLI